MFERIHIIISLFAGLLVTIFSIIYHVPFNLFVIRLCIVICVFYVLGLIIKEYLRNKVFINENYYFFEEDEAPKPNPKNQPDTLNEEDASKPEEEANT